MKSIKVFVMCICLFFSITLVSQNNLLSIEIIPYASMKRIGTGLNISYHYYFNNSFGASINGGIMYASFDSGLEKEFFTSNGVQLSQWSNSIDIYTSQPFPLNEIVDSDDFEYFSNQGFKHYKPHSSFRLNRFVNLKLQYRKRLKKISFDAGLGPMIGLANRDDVIVGFTGEIILNATGQRDSFWVNLNFKTRYLFFGLDGNLGMKYHINDRLTIGVNGGINYILNRNLIEDEKYIYTGITTSVAF